MGRAARSDKLAALAAQAREILALSRPTTAYVLRVLDALTASDIQILGQWELDGAKAEGVVDRLTEQMAEKRQVIRKTLSRCLQFDLWGDYSADFETVLRIYRESAKKEVDIERALGCAAGTYSFLHYCRIGLWRSDKKDLSYLLIEDDHRQAVCEGYLVAKRRAFPTSPALLEASIHQDWRNWQALWRWF